MKRHFLLFSLFLLPSRMRACWRMRVTRIANEVSRAFVPSLQCFCFFFFAGLFASPLTARLGSALVLFNGLSPGVAGQARMAYQSLGEPDFGLAQLRSLFI